MRIWVDPARLAGLQSDRGRRGQRDPAAEPAARRRADRPAAGRKRPAVSVHTLGARVGWSTPEEFGQIVVKVGPDRQLVRVQGRGPRRDWAPRPMTCPNRFDGKPTVGLGDLPPARRQRPGNGRRGQGDHGADEQGLPAGHHVRDRLRHHPVHPRIDRRGVQVAARRDHPRRRSWCCCSCKRGGRPSIPLAAVPVAIIGTFAAMAAVGFCVNNLTLFGLVLAVGIVVDDAIVVVEAVQHQIEHGLPPREATIRAMDEVSGPVIAVGRRAVVRCSSRAPSSPASSAQFFRQFALTIAVCTLISTFNSLTLSPALCATLAARAARRQRTARLAGADDRTGTAPRLRSSAAVQPRVCRDWTRVRQGRGFRLARAVVRPRGLFCDRGRGSRGLQTMPTGFIPQQDKGYLVCSIQLPDAACAKRRKSTFPGSPSCIGPGDRRWPWQSRSPVKHVNAIAGNSFVLSAYGSNFGSMFIILDGFDERQSPKLSADAVSAELARSSRAAKPGGAGERVRRPGRSGLGSGGRLPHHDRGPRRRRPRCASGPDREVHRRGATSRSNWSACSRCSRPTRRSSSWTWTAAQCRDPRARSRRRVRHAPGIDGHRYINDFNRFGRTWQVNVQADAAVPRQDRGREAAEGAEPPRRDGAARRGAERAGAERPAGYHAVQHVPGGRRERQRLARHQHRRGIALWRNWPSRNCRAAWPTNGPN